MASDTRQDDMRAAAAMAAANAADRADAEQAINAWNDRLAVVGRTWFFPTIGAALVTDNYWLHVICGGCNAVSAIDLRLKPCNSETPISEILPTIRCGRCLGQRSPAKPIGLFPTPAPAEP